MKKIIVAIFYWIIQLTWGCLLTIPGLLAAAFCIIFLKAHVKRNGCSIVIELGNTDWGGVTIGCVSMVSATYSGDVFYEHLRRHEFGHSVQQLLLGPFQIFLVAIPSIIRYWYRRLTPDKEHVPYDHAIFEYTASKLGYAWINWFENSDIAYNYSRK